MNLVEYISLNIILYLTGGRLLLEMNRILRPGGYFIISTSHGDVDREEGIYLNTLIFVTTLYDKVERGKKLSRED